MRPSRLSRLCLIHPSHSRFRSGEVGGAAPAAGRCCRLLGVVCGSHLLGSRQAAWPVAAGMLVDLVNGGTSSNYANAHTYKQMPVAASTVQKSQAPSCPVAVAHPQRFRSSFHCTPYSRRAQPDGCRHGGSGELRVHEPRPVRLGETKQTASVPCLQARDEWAECVAHAVLWLVECRHLTLRPRHVHPATDITGLIGPQAKCCYCYYLKR